MRGFVLVLFICVPLSGSTLGTSATCNGSVNQGTGGSSCSTILGTGAYAYASLTAMSVGVSAWTAYNWNTGTAETASASASLSEDFILTVTGGTGDGYAQPLLSAGGENWGAFAVAWAAGSLGGCGVSAAGTGPPSYCSPMSVPFTFGDPQALTLSESAGVSAGPYDGGTPSVASGVNLDGFEFFNAEGQPLSDVSYTFLPAGAPSETPEPDTLPLLTGIVCAALMGLARRDQAGSLSLSRK